MSLSLCWNGFTDAGAQDLAISLRAMTHALRSIDLSYNRITQETTSKEFDLTQASLRCKGHIFGFSLPLRVSRVLSISSPQSSDLSILTSLSSSPASSSRGSPISRRSSSTWSIISLGKVPAADQDPD